MGSSLLFVLFQSDCIAPGRGVWRPRIDGWATQFSNGATHFLDHLVYATVNQTILVRHSVTGLGN
jgi:hypothetical protein